MTYGKRYRVSRVSRVSMISMVVGSWLLAAGGCGDDDGGQPEVVRFRVVTFNTGSTGPTGTVLGEEWTTDLKTIGDELYGNGLAWKPAVETTRQWLAEVNPEVIVFQEIFGTQDCSDIPAAERAHFVCEDWQPGDDTVAQVVLGQGYQVMCHPGNNDKCGAVRLDFGRFRECDSDYCHEGFTGAPVPDCGHGSRVGRGTIELVAGGTLTLVNFHGSSGVVTQDMECRLQQVNQVFVDLTTGDGQPAANGDRNLVMGDFNADPVRWASFDVSAARWLDFVTNPDDPESTPGRPFHFISEVGKDAEPTYAAMFNIDHVVSDTATGTCWVAGVSPDRPYVLGADLHFDHRPIICDVEMPQP
jgi:Endonuclease/Exonuclease/phosphatase family